MSDLNHNFISSQKSKSTTFRLDSFVLGELQREANQNETSLNVLVNQILKEYIEWGKYERKLGLIPVPKILLSSLIHETMLLAESNGIPIKTYREKLIKYAAEIAFSNIKDCVIVMKKKFDFWSVLSVLEEYMKISGIKADHKIEAGGKHVFIIQHELGENWSLFTKELLSLIFENLAKVRIESSITPNTTIAEVTL